MSDNKSTNKKSKECDDCLNQFNELEGRPYKYEPEIWLCDNCHDYRIANDE